MGTDPHAGLTSQLLIRLFVSGLWCMCEFIRLTSQLWCLGLLDCASLPRDSLKVEMEFWKRCATGNIEAVQAAIRAGRDVNERKGDGSTGLVWAVSNKHNNIVELLLDCPDIEVNCQDRMGNTPLHAAAEVDNVFGLNLLLAHRNMASLNFRNSEGHTPLMFAVGQGGLNCASQLLMVDGIDLNTRDGMGLTLEEVAGEVGATEMIELIQGVRMGLGVGVLRDEETDDEDVDATNVREGEEINREEIEEEEEEEEEEEGEIGQMVQGNHMIISRQNVLSDLKRRQSEKLERLLQQNEQRLARVEQENQERLESTKRENEERSRRVIGENEEQVAQMIQDNEAEVSGLISHLWKSSESNASSASNASNASNASSAFTTTPLPDCPVCLEQMAPPTNIFQCTNGHLLCAQCRLSLDPCICPRCRSEITGRATDMEHFLRSYHFHWHLAY